VVVQIWKDVYRYLLAIHIEKEETLDRDKILLDQESVGHVVVDMFVVLLVVRIILPIFVLLVQKLHF
jgi:hypothetical protein